MHQQLKPEDRLELFTRAELLQQQAAEVRGKAKTEHDRLIGEATELERRRLECLKLLGLTDATDD